MTPIEFDGFNVTYSKNQPPYIPLPARKEENGRLTFCWALSWRERLRVLFSGRVWHQTLTFNQPLQPQKLLAERPE